MTQPDHAAREAERIARSCMHFKGLISYHPEYTCLECLTIALRTTHARAVEQAARVADDDRYCPYNCPQIIATAIRALKEEK